MAILALDVVHLTRGPRRVEFVTPQGLVFHLDGRVQGAARHGHPELLLIQWRPKDREGAGPVVLDPATPRDLLPLPIVVG